MTKNGTGAFPIVPKGEAKASRLVSGMLERLVVKKFVLDTNVLMHDSSCLFSFQEHDVYIPPAVLDELDNHKSGMTEIARNAREVSRTVDRLLAEFKGDLSDGISLCSETNKSATGRLFLVTEQDAVTLPKGMDAKKNDNLILSFTANLSARYPDAQVIVVSKDLNVRIKARVMGLLAQDYRNDAVLEDSDILYSGMLAVDSAEFWQKVGKGVECTKSGDKTTYRITGSFCQSLFVNQFIVFDNKDVLRVTEKKGGKTAILETVVDYMRQKNEVWGITSRNIGQSIALNMLMDPDVDIVTLLGQAGTGKTLLTLAAGLHQVLETKQYAEIIMTRATEPIGKDIGFLPGTEEEKMAPWMGALDDNLDVLTHTDEVTKDNGTHHPTKLDSSFINDATRAMMRSKIKVKSLSFMRGRTFLKKYLIIDEAQNLTPKQMKALVTRAGPGTKVVCLGNLAQIDTPYLTEGSSGLTHVVDSFKDWPHSGHITLERGERSRLADYASDVL